MDNNVTISTGLLSEEATVDTRGVVKNKKGKIVQSKILCRRSILIHVLATLFIQIFNLFWIFQIDKEIKAIAQKNDDTSSCKVVIFSIITLGIYCFYWCYKVGKRQSAYYQDNGISAKSKLARNYLLIAIIGMIVCAALSTVTANILNAIVPSMFQFYLFTFLYAPITLVPFVIVFGMMQSNNNYMLGIEERKGYGKIYVRNSDILNRVFWGTLLLFLGSEIIIPMFGAFGKNIVYLIQGQTGSVDSDGNLMDSALKQAVYDVTNCDQIQVLLPNLLTILGAFVCLLILVYWFRNGKYDGVLKCKYFGKAFLLCLPAYFLAAANIANFFIEGSCNIKFGLVVLGFVPGIVEEVTFRGLIIPNILRVFNRKSGIYAALIISSLVFGLVHLSNIIAGADVGSSLYQVFYGSALGFVFAAVLIRTGNLWASILAHSFIDVLAYMSPAAMEQGAIQTQAFTWDTITIGLVVVYVFMIVYAFYLVRPQKHNEILTLWRSKFGNAMLKAL